MARRTRKRRIPKLLFTKTRNIGWYVSYRDPATGVPRRQRFGNMPQGEAEKVYHKWVAEWLGDDPRNAEHPHLPSTSRRSAGKPLSSGAKVTPGSLVHVTTGFIRYEDSRSRKPGDPHQSGTIAAGVARDRTKHAKDFLAFLNQRHGEKVPSRG